MAGHAPAMPPPPLEVEGPPAKHRTTCNKKPTGLSPEERQALAEELMGFSDPDGAWGQQSRTWMDKLGAKLDEYGIDPPQVEVVYRNLTVTTPALVGAASVPNVFTPLINLGKVLLCMRQQAETRPLKLLDDMSGVLKPGRMTLLLGPPSSGKSTLLKVLAGRLDVTRGQTVEGDIWYNGKHVEEFHQRRSAAYVAQIDNHEPNLTVSETLDFAWICQNGLHGSRFNLPREVYLKKLAAQQEGEAADRLEAGVPAVKIVTAPAGDGETSSRDSTDAPGGGKAAGSNGHNGAGPGTHTPPSLSEEEDATHGPVKPRAINVGGSGGGDSTGEVKHVGITLPKTGSGRNAVSSSHPGTPKTDGHATPSGAGGLMSRVWSRNASHRAAKEACPAVDMEPFEEVMSQAWGTLARVDVFMKLLGLYHCKETQVGNEVFRGISGGERKRLTTAEQILGPHSVLMLDEISTGLDSATLYTVMRWFSKMAHALRRTMLVSLLQPPPEVFQLFDDVLIMTEGKVLYHGPVNDAVGFFADLGLVCPNRKDVPSFLLEVTTHQGQMQYATPELRAAKGVPPEGEASIARHLHKELMLPLSEISNAFWTTNQHGIAMARELAAAPMTRATHPAALVFDNKYPLSLWESVWATTRRQTTLVLRDRVLLRGRVMQIIILSFITGSLFWDLPTTLPGARSFFGLAFLLVLMISFGGFPQLPITIEAKKVWFKHRDNRFMPAVAQGSAMALAQIPLSVIETIIFSVVLYWMVGLYPNAGYFFTFMLIGFCNSLTSSAIFRFVACIFPDAVTANGASGILLLTLVVSSGFAIVRTDIPPWMIWAYYLSPFAWGLRAFVVNEMTSPDWQSIPSPGDPSVSMGDAALLSFGFFTDRSWIWTDIAFQIGAYLVLTLGSILSLWYLKPPTPAAVLPDEAAVATARADAEAHRAAMNAKREVMAQRSQMGKSESRKQLGDDGNGRAEESTPDLQQQASKRGVGTMAVEAEVDIASSLEFTPITLVFQNVKYTVPNPNYSRKAAKAVAKAAQQDADGKKSAASVALAASGQATGLAPALSGRGSSELEQALAREAKQAALTSTQERLQLLSGITGYSEPGVLTALMGGSGAGKTTLMDVLAGRKTIGEITGDITVNGHPKDQRTWSRVVGYCEQTDIHTPLATVKEALMFSARLRLPPSVTDAQVRAYVEEVLDIVDLMDIQFALVGTPGVSGLSVEQRKRLTIGVELVANPSVLFLDEPTSGLDARAAVIVMQAVRNLARNGRTVMVTIHQPSIEIFEAFDMLLLIQKGGKTTYFGPLGEHSSRLIEYLMSVPGTPPLPPNYNPATWMLEVTGGSMATTVQRVDVDWPLLYEGSQLAADARAHAVALVDRAKAEGIPALTQAGQYAMPFRAQLVMLLRKFWLVYWRNPAYNLARLFTTFTTSWIYAAVYWGQGQVPNPASIANVQAVMGIMYSSINFLGMTNLMLVMPLIGYERVVFYRERAASMYSPWAYGLAISSVELPWLILLAAVYMPITYWTVDFLHDALQFWYFAFMFLGNIFYYNTLGHALTYITPSQGIAQVVGGAINMLMNVFNGFLIPYNDIPNGWKWANRAVPTTWVIYGLAISQLHSESTIIPYNGQVYTMAAFMEAFFDYHISMQWWCLLILVANIIFLRAVAVLALRYINFLRR